MPLPASPYNYGQWHDQLHKLKGGAGDVGANQLALRCSEAERIKPFEITASLAQTHLDAVRLAQEDAQTAITAYLASRLRAERL